MSSLVNAVWGQLPNASFFFVKVIIRDSRISARTASRKKTGAEPSAVLLQMY